MHDCHSNESLVVMVTDVRCCVVAGRHTTAGAAGDICQAAKRAEPGVRCRKQPTWPSGQGRQGHAAQESAGWRKVAEVCIGFFVILGF